MVKTKMQQEFELRATRRYRRQNMAKAMGGKIERGLVELITNSDDSYRDLEELSLKVSGKIKIEVERKRGSSPSVIRVLDRASGMSGEEMYNKLGTVGERTSGYEKGKVRRGLYGRGAKDVAIFGSTHFESIKDGKYSHLIITPSLAGRFETYQQDVGEKERERLGIPRGNGTVVTIEVSSGYRIPHHEKLLDVLSRYYSLRDIMSNPYRELILSDIKSRKSTRLLYEYPEGNIILDRDFEIPGYPDATAHLLIRQHETAFQIDTLPLREGILIKSGAAIHDCTHFHLEPDIYCWRFTGEVRCDYIDTLIREYDDRESTSANPIHPSNNPIMLLDPNRNGLDENHPFTLAINQLCRKLLKNLVDDLRVHETPPKKKVSNEFLDKKLDSLSKAISKLFESKLKELEEDIELTSELQGTIANLPIGLHIIPPGEEHITVNVPKVFTVKIVGYEGLSESLPITISSSEPTITVRLSPVYLKKFSEDKRVATTTFILESDVIGAEALIEVNYNGYNDVVLVDVVEPSIPLELPPGLSFDKPIYHLKVNKEKTLYLYLSTGNNSLNEHEAEVISDRREIVVKGGRKCILRKTSNSGIFMGKCHVIGRRSKVKGGISASVHGFQPAHTNLVVEDKELRSHVKLQFFPDEDDFGSVRYKWDDEHPYVLKIAAKHPSIRQYLGIPEGENYPGIDSRLYHGILAEVVAEALAFSILERQFRTEGQGGMLDYTTVDANYHKHYSDFLTICHQTLNPNAETLSRQSKLL
jgi:hypothetical protein